MSRKKNMTDAEREAAREQYVASEARRKELLAARKASARAWQRLHPRAFQIGRAIFIDQQADNVAPG